MPKLICRLIHMNRGVFYINDKQFNTYMNFQDELIISSRNKDYIVHYGKCSIDMIYNKNDIIIIDTNVYNIMDKAQFVNKSVYMFIATEINKNITSVLNIIDYMFELKLTKNNKLIIIGGGITQEVGGFASAIYKRGIKWIYIPTTVLAMTDSCIGSKVSLNHTSKNILGLMEAPDDVYIDDTYIMTLSKNGIISGLGEALKLSLI